MRLSHRLAAAALALGLPAAAHAQCAAPGAAFDLGSQFYAFARINGTLYNFSCLITPTAGGTRALSFTGGAAAAAAYTLGSTTARAYLSGFSVTFDPQGTGGVGSAGDPSITWSIGTRTALASSVTADPTFDFAFAFGMPVARRTYGTASASGGFTVSNANARAVEGDSLTPASSFAPLASAPAGWSAALTGAAGPLHRQPFYEQLLADGAAATGIGAGTDACRLRDPNPTARARQRVCEFETGDQTLGSSVGSLGVVVQYRQFGVVTGAMTGTMVASPVVNIESVVPEPGSIVLTASGLVGLLGAAAARRRRAGA